jgi:hypothetical protein
VGGGTTGGGSGGGVSGVCDGLAEDACAATPGCVVDRCIECSCTPVFLGCRTSAEPQHECPPVDCVGPTCCHAQSDCGSTVDLVCLAPGGTLGCPICMQGTSTCTVDTDCGGGLICDPIACSCNNATACVPGCSTGQCPEGQECGNGAHPRCVAQGCNAAYPCPAAFDCQSNQCVRRQCNVDADCGDHGLLYCVDGACYSSLGACTPQPL